MRWVFTILIIVVLRDSAPAQICLLLSASLFFQSLHLYSKPFEKSIDQKIAFFNELMISIYLYLLICLTDFHGDSSLRENIGFALLLIVLLTVGINFVKVVFVNMHLLKFEKCRSSKAQKYATNTESVNKKLDGTVITIREQTLYNLNNSSTVINDQPSVAGMLHNQDVPNHRKNE